MSHFGILLPTQVSRKTCSSCFAAIKEKRKVAAKKRDPGQEVGGKGPEKSECGKSGGLCPYCSK